jgi:hypothetical protein
MCATHSTQQLWLVVASWTKINSSDPQMPAVSTAYPTEPFLPFFHPPIELARFRPRGHGHLDRGIDYATIRFGTLLYVCVAEVHI